MVKLEIVEYGKENGQLVAIEIYSDGSSRKVQIKNGMVDYILNGSNDEQDEKRCPECNKQILTKVSLGEPEGDVLVCQECDHQEESA